MNGRPFVFGVAASGENFTDREKETERLLQNFRYGVNTILISPRRWGKTSLVKKVVEKAQSENLKVVYLDIFSCRNAQEFFNSFATAVIRQTSSRWEEIVENADKDIEDILNLPERIAIEKGIRVVVCIDEFQQIGEFSDSLTFQKRLRAVWQLQSKASYCLFGSKRHRMNKMFESRSHPFYKFGDAMYLQKIPTEYWVKYIAGRFESTGKSIENDLAERICATVDNHSSYVQQLSWLVWVHTDKKANEESYAAALDDLLAQNTPLFVSQTENLTAYQLNFLKALSEGISTGLSTDKVISQYNLGSSANVASIKKALMQQELIETEGRVTKLSDPVMGLWLQLE